jgi:hypothetical protein
MIPATDLASSGVRVLGGQVRAGFCPGGGWHARRRPRLRRARCRARTGALFLAPVIAWMMMGAAMAADRSQNARTGRSRRPRWRRSGRLGDGGRCSGRGRRGGRRPNARRHRRRRSGQRRLRRPPTRRPGDAGTVDAEQARLAQAGLAAVDERDTTCCYARQDKFWVTGAPGGERWEIYTVLADSATFWGQDSEQRWDAVQAELDAPAAQATQATQCCGGPQ